MKGPVYSFNTPVADAVANRVGPWARDNGFQTVQTFGWLDDPSYTPVADSVYGAGLEWVRGAIFGLADIRPPLYQLLDPTCWQRQLATAKRLGVPEWCIYLEDYCGMNDCDAWTPDQARAAALAVAKGCTPLLIAGITPIIYGPCYRPDSFKSPQPYAVFCELLWKLLPAGARLWEVAACSQDGALVGALSDHPIDFMRYPAAQRLGNWGGVSVAAFKAQFAQQNALERAIYYGNPSIVTA